MSTNHFLLCPLCGRVPCPPTPFVTVACPQCGWRRSDDGFPPVGAPNPALEHLYPSGTTATMTVESRRADIPTASLRDFPAVFSAPAESVRVFVGGVELPPGTDVEVRVENPVQVTDGRTELRWVQESRLGVTPGGDGGEGGRGEKVAEKRKPPAPWRAGERWLDLP